MSCATELRSRTQWVVIYKPTVPRSLSSACVKTSSKETIPLWDCFYSLVKLCCSGGLPLSHKISCCTNNSVSKKPLTEIQALTSPSGKPQTDQVLWIYFVSRLIRQMVTPTWEGHSHRLKFIVHCKPWIKRVVVFPKEHPNWSQLS